MDSLKSITKDDENGTGSKLSSYLEQLCGQTEFTNTVELDHNYSKPWNWRPDNTYAKPLKSLFVNKTHSQSSPSDDILDPVSLDSPPKPAYDEEKARKYMEDPWRQIRLLRADVGDLDWDLKIDRRQWSLHQSKIFDRGSKILHYDRLARLSYVGNWNEPVLRRLSIDRSARQLRTLFSNYGWQHTLIRWLHYLWLDILHHDYLVAYIEILQVLKKKVPNLIERLTLGNTQSTKANSDILFMMLQTPWDPANIALPCHIPRRLPGNPLLLIVPCGSGNGTNNSSNTRLQRWFTHLSAIGTVSFVNTNKMSSGKVTVTNSLEHLMSSTRAKVAELKSDYIGRNIILIGLNSGAALACQVSLVEPVSAIVCLGFPMNTVEEKRGQPDDSLLNLTVPTLFVIGQHAATAHVNDLEDLRERLRVHTSLVVVGAADDCLRISRSKRSADGMTQTMVDRCIVDEVADFIGTVLLTPNHKPDNRNTNTKARMKFVERKRKISINDDPIAKKHRMNPVNRPKKNTTPRSVNRNTKWISNEGDRKIQTISRRANSIEDNKTLITRPSIDSIRILNKNMTFKHNTGDMEDGETYSILSEIKVIGGEDCTGENSFVGQLTADRLLEMPVIIAQEDCASAGSGTLNGNASSHQQMQPVKVMVTSGSGIIREESTGMLVNASKETGVAEVTRQTAGIRCVPAPPKTSTIHIGRTAASAVVAAAKTLHSKTTLASSKVSDNSGISTGAVTKCATIYFRDQPKTSVSTITQAQLHKMDILSRTNSQSQETTTIRRRNFPTQLISRPRPPRIRNFPAIKHGRSDLTSSGQE